ncbi:hypothetical protein [Mechercharimyces sp. CAU 1602]|uniref:hypothetical protein n=1 Tax=Mechercharimyces sp. CAU 1602 TaxID=2973933 RepID=UPI002161B4CF|nr:hypothetical protein [Mechercharimyces sp. CAU 1602]MCS1350907.1 hypothetical protein [Mechercharimyces sp. CAU 1602]
MGISVLLLKEKEHNGGVIYKYGPNEQLMGRIELNTKILTFHQLSPVPGEEGLVYYNRAAGRLARFYYTEYTEGSVFPDELFHFS